MLSLFIRNLVFFMLHPGIVVFLIPYILVNDRIDEAFAADFSMLSYIGIALVVFGLLIVLYCIYSFIIDGGGTLSPVDKTKALVVRGLYKYSRNPMYVGIMLILFGEVLFTRAIVHLGYTIFVFIVFHLFVIFIEEPRLKRDFKNDYTLYTSRVKRWF